MAKRLGLIVVDDRVAGTWRYKAKAEGAEAANLAGNCERPIPRSFVGMRDQALSGLAAMEAGAVKVTRRMMDNVPVFAHGLEGGRIRFADILVRCRKCGPCLRARGAHWRMRAQHELQAASRNWFSTFTLRPERHAKHLYETIRHEERRGNRWETLNRDQRFLAICRPIKREWQLYMKRVRASGAVCRYLMVIERHNGGGQLDGLPHMHALIHELGEPVRHKTLTSQWLHGFTTHKLVNEKAASAAYVCKYLTKDVINRPLASLRYGQIERS